MHISVGLRIMSDTLEPDLITAELGLEPSRFWKMGEPIATSSGENPASSGGWFLYSDSVIKSTSLAAHFDWIVQKLAPAQDKLHQLIEKGYWIDLCCNLASENPVGFALSSATMAALGSLGLEVDFTIDTHLADDRHRSLID